MRDRLHLRRLRDGRHWKHKKHQTAERRGRRHSGHASHDVSGIGPPCYDGLIVKLISRVNVLFASLSVTLISSR